MAKKIREAMALILSVCICVSMMIPMQVFADDVNTTTETTVNEGLTTTVSTTVDTTNPTIVVEIVKTETTGTDSEGATVDYEESVVTTTTTSSNGTITEATVTDGSETKGWTQDVQPGQDVPSVNVDLKPGETVTKTESGTNEETVDNIPEGSTATNSDVTTTETTTDRTVTATTSNIEITEVNGRIDMTPVGPEDYEGKTNVSNTAGNGKFGPDRTGVKYLEIPLVDDNGEVVLDDSGNEVIVKVPNPEYWDENWDYQYFESGERSTSGSVYTRLLVFEKDADGNYLYDENGNIKYYWDWWSLGVDPHPNTSFSRTVGTYMNVLWDKDGNLLYTYCLDKNTGMSHWGQGYILENLDDCTYFPTEEAKDNIRAVTTNGYWGTEDGVGSLKQMKENAQAWIESDEEITFTVKNVTYTNTTEEGKAQLLAMLEALNEGDAINSTQAAIWSYANGTSSDVQNSSGGKVFHGFNTSDWGSYYKNDPNPENGGALARMWLAYHYLMALEPEAKSETTVINKESFLADDGMQLVIGNKVSDTAADENGVDHDVYSAELSFTMVVAPSTDNGDDMIVILYDGEGNIVRKARIAGNDAEDDATFTKLIKNGNTYTFKDLHLSENSDITFDLRLEGVQNLGAGVYVYKAIDDNGNSDYALSQTMIGISSGTQEVCIDTTFTVNFSVEEDQSIVATRVWHNESDPIVTPPANPPENPGNTNEPTTNYPTTDDGEQLSGWEQMVADEEIDDEPVPMADSPELETIEDEEVPLADVPYTGDISNLMLLIPVLALACLLYLNKKNGNVLSAM